MLQLTDVSKSFRGVLALSDVSLTVSDGEVLGIIGPNGSGKTSLFNVLSRLVEPDRGTVMFGGCDLLKLRPHQVVSKGVVRVFQNSQLCADLTVFENITMAAYARGRRLILKDVIERIESLRFDALTCKLGRYPDRLSQFERRQAEIVRAVISEAKLLLLDEPTAGFADAERALFAEAIKSINASGISVLLIEHDLSLIQRVSSGVIVLDAGRKIAEGRPEDIAKDKTVTEVYVGKTNAAAQ